MRSAALSRCSWVLVGLEWLQIETLYLCKVLKLYFVVLGFGTLELWNSGTFGGLEVWRFAVLFGFGICTVLVLVCGGVKGERWSKMEKVGERTCLG